LRPDIGLAAARRQPVGTLVGSAAAARTRLRLAALQIDAQFLGQTRLAVGLRALALLMYPLGHLPPVPPAICPWRHRLARSQEKAALWPCRGRLAAAAHNQYMPCAGGTDMAEVRRVGCGSSVVEHPLGKGEAESSILSR